MIRHVTQPCLCMTTSIIIKITRVISMWTPHWITVRCHGIEGPMTTGYYCAIFPFCGGGKKKAKKKKGILWLGYHRYPSKNGNSLKKHEDWVTGKHEQRDFFFHLIGWGGDASFLANRREEHSKTGFSSTIRPDCLRKSNKRIFSCNEWFLLFFQIQVGIPDVNVTTFKLFF